MPLPKVEPHTLTPEDVARRMRVSVDTVYRWIACGDLDAVDCAGSGPGPRWRIRESALAEFVELRNAGRRNSLEKDPR